MKGRDIGGHFLLGQKRTARGRHGRSRARGERNLAANSLCLSAVQRNSRRSSRRPPRMDPDGLTEAPNATLEVVVSEDDVGVATGLESFAARASILSSLPQHRLAASSVLLVMLAICAIALFVLVVRRPVLRRGKLPPLRRTDEWTPVARADANLLPHAVARPGDEAPSIQLPGQRTGSGLPASRAYNTFGGDGDAAWQAAKADWHAAIAAAKRLHSGTEPASANVAARPCAAGPAPDRPG